MRCNTQEFIVRLVQPKIQLLGIQSLVRHANSEIFSIAYNLRSASMGVWVVGLSATLFKKVIIDSVGFVWFCALC